MASKSELIEQNTPVHQDQGKWYFWDEVWAQRFGPFDSEEMAAKACTRYAMTVLDGGEDPYPEIKDIPGLKWE